MNGSLSHRSLAPLALSPSKITVANMGYLFAGAPVSTTDRRPTNLPLIYKPSEDENANRRNKIQKILQKFEEELTKLKDSDGFNLKENSKGSLNQLYSIIENVFTLYNTHPLILTHEQQDSAIRIDPLHHPSRGTYILICIAYVLTKFPYSLIKLIELNKFSVCKSIQVKKDQYEDISNSRICNNGLFAAQEHNTYEKIERHFYRILLYHIQKKMPSIDFEWPIERQPKLSSLTNSPFMKPRLTALPGQVPIFQNSPFRKSSLLVESEGRSEGGRSLSMSPSLKFTRKHTVSGTQIIPSSSSPSKGETKSREQYEVFCKLMRNCSESVDSPNSRVAIKSRFLREKLECLDPIGINEEWWAASPNYSSVTLENLASYLV